MANKKEKLILIDLRYINGNIKDSFKVKKVVNTTNFRVDEYLPEKRVSDEIMYNDDMTVEIVSNL